VITLCVEAEDRCSVQASNRFSHQSSVISHGTRFPNSLVKTRVRPKVTQNITVCTSKGVVVVDVRQNIDVAGLCL